MQLTEYQEFLERSPFVRSFIASLSQERSGVLAFNLNTSAKAMLAAQAWMKLKRNVILVSVDDRSAEEYAEDLHLLAGAKNAWFLPDFELLPYEERSPHYTIRGQRIETLSRAVSGQPAIYSVGLRGFLRRIVSHDTFKSNIIELSMDAEFDPDVLLSNLSGMGYQREYQVSRVGEMARRGGIIDVFSPNRNHPVRVEFFGDEVVSIREFSVGTQRSLDTRLNQVTLIPSREFSIHNIEADEEMWKKIHNGGFYDGFEQDAPLLLKKLDTFVDYLDQPLIFFDEFQYFSGYVQEIEEETVELWRKARVQSPRRKLPDPPAIFENMDHIRHLISHKQVHFLSGSYQDMDAISTHLEAPVTSQTVMHSDLSLLEQSLNEKISQDYHIFIQSDNRSQSKRMRELLPELEDRITFLIGVLHKGFNLTDCGLAIFTDHEIFSRYKKRSHRARFSRDEALVDYESLKPGDYIVHIDYGIGVFEGLKNVKVEGVEIECLSLQYADGDRIYVPTYQLDLVSRFVSEEGYTPTVHKLGGKKWEQARKRARKQIETVAEDIVKLYAERKMRRGIAFSGDNTWQKEMEDSFIYEDTPDQARASLEIKDDMSSESPMERLLCGDVGFGKTEVAIRAAFKAALSGYQVAVLVPTTLLAEQHYLVFRERLAQYPVHIAMFSRFRSPSQIKKDVVRLSEGNIDIAIGTHRLLSADMRFKRLGLLIIDEEHRFGVRHKEKIRKLKSNVDTLYMSATPIPRTLNMALSRLKEISLMQTSPKARLPVRTIIVPFDEEVIKDAINREIDRGGQVFFVHNRVQTIDSMATDLRRLMPGIRFQVAHGQMPEKQLEAVMLDFSHHKFDVLLTTTIIESGIDIPNANTMLVNRADMFGLAQLYQLRGRVGRSNRRAYAYLMIPGKMNEVARKRLETLTEYDYLGAGYQIAMRDLEIRGAGTLLGTRQSGVINTIGFNYYNRMLEKMIENIENEVPKDQWDEEDAPKPIRIESDHFFPVEYIENEETRLGLYRRMLGFEKPDDFEELSKELRDRFGEIPGPAEHAILSYQVRMLADHSILRSFQLRAGQAVLEFDASHMPPRERIGQLLQEFRYPVHMDSTGNLKIMFTIEDKPQRDRRPMLRKAVNMLRMIHGWTL